MFRVFQADLGFVEGPVTSQGGSVLVTSIDRGVLYRISQGSVAEFARTGGGPNGLVEGPRGEFYVSQNGGAWPARNTLKAEPGVQAVSPEGEVTMLARGLKSPNDLAFGPDGYLYVTDP